MSPHTTARHHRGAAPVGVLAEMDPVELAAIRHLRLWFSGKQDHIWHDFHNRLDPQEAEQAMLNLETLMDAVQYDCRRPVMRHSESCDCVGGDESAFSHFIAAAHAGEMQEALTFGLLLFRGSSAHHLLEPAAHCGRIFACLADLHMPRSIAQTASPTHPMPKARQ
ncbi:MAG: hypothetical protein CSA68_09470 [Rhodobacterales bacterium]|nr:MAG: hypothetical protein CSA68_09470 [Rhodobacterales bacterium]